ncbi:Ras-related and estrogen-regulated growth inhibitor-like protein [Holothuria leucospilota]|uniref:small monomeric GTPase n=1 Tax=Holothuria leucospilota TaxID=206669 RepID=A0A9Q1H1W8_HOLLE|nr:Ras-related and estrogen-regulated growth inhibitor-like protein [Holothuria leucospilota]
MKAEVVNILVLGAENVGKSALTVRFLTKRFIGDYQSDEDTVYQHSVDCQEEHYNVSVLDTCSKAEENRNLAEQIRWADAIVVVYDVSRYQSFDIMQDQLRLLNRMATKKSSQLPTVVLANKVDLHPKAHKVGRDEGKLLAEEYGCQFFEVSAADGWQEVAQAFQSVIKLAEQRRKKIRSPLVMRKRSGSVTRHVAHKVLQVVSWSPKRS